MILAVCSGKGGVGKSTLAYELAGALKADTRGAVVVDADLGMANLPRGRGPDLHDVLAGRADPAEAVRGGPVDILQCGRSLAGARAADVGKLGDALSGVADERDVVIDCPAGLRADAGVPLAVADACVLVASPRAWALSDAIRTKELARELDAGVVAVALNRVQGTAPRETARESARKTTRATACETARETARDALEAPTTVVPEDPRLDASLSGEKPVVERAPESSAARAIRDLADAVRTCRPYYETAEVSVA